LSADFGLLPTEEGVTLLPYLVPRHPFKGCPLEPAQVLWSG